MSIRTVSFELMLQFYDKRGISKSLIAAAACIALGQPASADIFETEPALCDLSNGLSPEPAAFVGEAGACMDKASAVSLEEVEAQISALSERHRARYGLEPLIVRDSLTRAARTHAMDMVTRSYASHVSPEGLGHSDRLRRLDRSAFFGATGASIVVLEADTTAIDAFNAIISEPVNAENLRRTTFSHSGVGVATAADGTLVVVQLFAKVDGLLDTPLPPRIVSDQSADLRLIDADFRMDGLQLASLQDGNVAPVARSIVPARHRQGTAGLEMEASLGTTTFTLHGPVFSIDK
ncbi:MAG: CAP domain-containing protein [Pseudomonadota bacterium]